MGSLIMILPMQSYYDFCSYDFAFYDFGMCYY